jgi:NADPH-dependent 2,4-dienoyl-CoA reductase/sulfur reductase-like enzyme/nitrite reductase/ring-hydroxylating ferredoxin subunit
MGEPAGLRGPNFAETVPLHQLPEGTPVMGHFEGEPVVVVRRGDEVFAIGGTCSHYGAPLDGGLAVGETLRCPWHHACFSLRTGEALAAPAQNPVPSYRLAREAGGVRILGKAEPAHRRSPHKGPSSVVIIGAGAAGAAAAETLRREGYQGPVTLVGQDPFLPYDRPNLSKDYLAGNAPEAWLPLRTQEQYAQQSIELRTGIAATGIDIWARTVTLANGERLRFGGLLLATGARPRRLPIPGAERGHVHTLRSLADCQAIIEQAQAAKQAVVVGAGFIGLEVAAALRTRGLAVHVVAPDAQPLGRILGAPMGEMIRAIHEAHGVVFHLGLTLQAIGEADVTLSDGTRLPGDLVVVGVGVEPDVELASRAGLTVDRGVVVNAHLQTSAANIYAAGDIARWPDPHTHKRIRVEHWAVAQRQGQTAARNLLGAEERFAMVPFFWSAHFDVTVAYVGHAETWDRMDIDGDLLAHDCRVDYFLGGRRLAVATVGRDRDSLLAEAEAEAALAAGPAAVAAGGLQAG